MNVRGLCPALDHGAVRELLDAEHFAEKIGKKLNTTVTIHPKFLAEYPADVGRWLSKLLNTLRVWCTRAGFGYYAIWVRENYEGDRREHIHLLMYVPAREREAFATALRRWLPGSENVIDIGKPEYGRDRFGRVTNKALTYMLKQMTLQAWFALDKRVRREKHCRETHMPVAPVLGRKWNVSRTLNKAARDAFWTARRPAVLQPARTRLAAS